VALFFNQLKNTYEISMLSSLSLSLAIFVCGVGFTQTLFHPGMVGSSMNTNIGINTDLPSAQLHIKAGSPSTTPRFTQLKLTGYYMDEHLSIFRDNTLVSSGGGPPYQNYLNVYSLEHGSLLSTYTKAHLHLNNVGLGIGIDEPQAKLSVRGPANQDLLDVRQSNTTFAGTTEIPVLFSGTNANVGVGSLTPSSKLTIESTNTVSPFSINLNYGSVTTPIYVAWNGHLGLGTTTPNSALHIEDGNLTITDGQITVNDGNNQFRVEPNGLVIARQVDVHVDPIPPDYVFEAAFNEDLKEAYAEDDFYTMMTLDEVEAYVKKHKHLPGVKSADEFLKDKTINIAEFQFKLLEKIEELTLYNIEMKKELDKLKTKVDEMDDK